MTTRSKKFRMRAIAGLALPLGLILAVDMSATEAVAGNPAKAKQSRGASSLNEINGLGVQELDDGTTILTIRGTREATFNVSRLNNPDRLVVEVASSKRGKVVPSAPVDSWAVGNVELRSVTEGGAKKTRVVVQLKRDASYIVVPKGSELVVTVTPREVPPEAYFARKSAGERKKEIDAMQASAQRSAVAASARAAEAEARAARAAAEAQDAKSAAERVRREASEVRGKAQEMLAQAEAATERAKAERDQARKARSDAEKALNEAKRAAAQAKKSGAKKAEVDRALAQARSAEKAARDRQTAAEAQLTKLSKDRKALEAVLDQQSKRSAAIDRDIAKKAEQLAALERQVTEARKAYDAVGGDASKQKLAEAQAQAAKTQVRHAALSKEVERLQRQVEVADAQLRKTQADLKHKRGAALARAKQAKSEAQKRLAILKDEYKSRRAALDAIGSELDSRRAELAKVEAQRSRLEREGAELTRKNAAAKKELEAREAALAKTEKSVAAQSQRLAALQKELDQAQAKLDKTMRGGGQSVGKKWESDRKAAGVAKVKDVRFEDTPTESRVIVDIDGPMVFAGSSLTPTMQLLRLEGTRIPDALERSLDTSSFNAPVGMITSFQEGGDVKIVVATNGKNSPVLEEKPGHLVWRFPRSTPGKRSEVVSMGTQVSGFVTPPAPMARNTGRRGKWRGERIDIELQDAPIKDVLLLFSDIGRVNIIAGRDVSGKVTMKLNSVPWDQALDIILRSLGLGMVQEGNVIRVATISDLEQERAKAIEEANARVQLKPLETRLVPLSYATVQEMLPKVQTVLSPRGQVTPDSRTNMLIIMDVAENIALAQQLISQLDSQTPQVLIEARIVEARTSWLRQLGIQWGFDYIASAGTGNPTGIAFPNAIGIGGGSGDQNPDTRGLILPAASANPNYAVDLPAPVGPGTGGAIGFSFGSISGNLNTNLRLSAAEDAGEVRIVSAPKIVTLDNTEAQIEQGVQIPISQVSAAGVNTRYVNATLALRVTPHVTNEGAVLLDVNVQKNEADFINTGARGDPTILTKQATSQMLITDGDTAVIGGIYTRNQSINRKKVPWLADIPIIGWFFKNKAEADTRTEMLIFLTPKIINRSTSIGG